MKKKGGQAKKVTIFYFLNGSAESIDISPEVLLSPLKEAFKHKHELLANFDVTHIKVTITEEFSHFIKIEMKRPNLIAEINTFGPRTKTSEIFECQESFNNKNQGRDSPSYLQVTYPATQQQQSDQQQQAVTQVQQLPSVQQLESLLQQTVQKAIEQSNKRQKIDSSSSIQSSATLTEIGKSELEYAKESKHYFNFDSTTTDHNMKSYFDGVRISGQVVGIEANSITSESKFIAFMTPYLQRCLGDNVDLVNSEEIAWLKSSHSDNKKKPDLFISHPALYTPKPPGNKQQKFYQEIKKDYPAHTIFNNFVWKFGTVDEQKLYNQIHGLVEVKMNTANTHELIGQLINDLRIIVSPNVHRSIKGMAILPQCFFLISCGYTGAVQNIIESTWTQAGSAKLIQDFFLGSTEMKIIPPPLPAVINGALNNLNLNISEKPFLGCGKFGYVFSCKQTSDNKVVALKIHIPETVMDYNLNKEFQILQVYKTKGIKYIASPASKTVISVFNSQKVLIGSAFSLYPVGTQVIPNKSKMYNILMALFKLHQQKVVHGDARLTNLIEVQEGGNAVYYWIDFMKNQVCIGLNVCMDMNTLIRSCWQISFSDKLTKLIADYGTHMADTVTEKVSINFLTTIYACLRDDYHVAT